MQKNASYVLIFDKNKARNSGDVIFLEVRMDQPFKNRKLNIWKKYRRRLQRYKYVRKQASAMIMLEI
jgi:hypothetical protein